MMSDPIRILLVDDHKVVREGLKAFIAPIANMKVVAEAVNGVQAVEQAQMVNPDVILMDLMMPVMDGIEATRQICTVNPDAHILVITSFAEDEKVIAAVQAGAMGYLLKDSTPQELEQAINDVASGETYLNPRIARKVIQGLPGPAKSELPKIEEVLTPREEEILNLVAAGMSNEEIANRLVLSVWTVRSHLGRIMDKLQVENRTQAALYVMRSGKK